MKQQTHRTPGTCSLTSALKPEERVKLNEIGKNNNK